MRWQLFRLLVRDEIRSALWGEVGEGEGEGEGGGMYVLVLYWSLLWSVYFNRKKSDEGKFT